MIPTIPLTRSNHRKALHHIVTNVLDPDHSDPDETWFIAEAFKKARFKSIDDFTEASEATISQLDYYDDQKNILQLEKVPIQILKNFLRFYHHLRKEGDENTLTTLIEWENITVDDFDNFRASSNNPSGPPLINLTTTHTRAAPATTTPVNNELITFQKGMKRDPTLFKELNNIDNWDTWKRNFTIQAKVQGCGEILDPHYSPATMEEITLFERKQEFMYSVLESKLNLDQGKNLIRKYQSTFDSQKIIVELTAHALTSTSASLTTQKLMHYITNAKLGTGD